MKMHISTSILNYKLYILLINIIKDSHLNQLYFAITILGKIVPNNTANNCNN